MRRELLGQDQDYDLTIVVQDRVDAGTREVLVLRLERLYRNINETYLTDLWTTRPQGLGATCQVENSDFWRGVMSDPLAEQMHHRAAIEYVFLTEDDVMQVISRRVPAIEVLPPADDGTNLPGLSEIWHENISSRDEEQ